MPSSCDSVHWVAKQPLISLFPPAGFVFCIHGGVFLAISRPTLQERLLWDRQHSYVLIAVQAQGGRGAASGAPPRSAFPPNIPTLHAELPKSKGSASIVFSLRCYVSTEQDWMLYLLISVQCYGMIQ